MAKILLIETSTALCSVAVSIDGVVVASRRDPNRAHASLTAVFCDEVLKEAGLIAGRASTQAASSGDGPNAAAAGGNESNAGAAGGNESNVAAAGGNGSNAGAAGDECRLDAEGKTSNGEDRLDAEGKTPNGECRLDAVCISEGPGSYTGLRVGLSTAKGICFGTGARLLSVGSLDILAEMARCGVEGQDSVEGKCCLKSQDGAAVAYPAEPGSGFDAMNCTGTLDNEEQGNTAQMHPEEPGSGAESKGTTAVAHSAEPGSGESAGSAVSKTCGTIVPMIDARRMEVYTATYSAGGSRLTPVEAKIIDSQSAADFGPDCTFIGDGALKCRDVIGHGRFIDVCPDAAFMGRLAEEQFRQGAFRDVAYFEPFYLKDFVVTTSKKKLF